MKGLAYLLQTTLILLWWIGLFVSPAFYAAFQFPTISPVAFNAFLLPDVLVVALLSLIRAYKSRKELEFIILGGFAFATLWCVNASLLTGGGWLSTTLMSLGLCYNIFLVFEARMFRAATAASLLTNGLKTFFQTLCVWTISLLVFPALIVTAFGNELSVATDRLVYGIPLLLLFSLLGIVSAVSMVRNGDGTPLPIDQTNRLVTSGPYRYVRNPMAISGLGQGLAVSIILASWPVFIYVVLGGVLWQLVVRPREEENMRGRFGAAYEDYRERINCWWPRW